MEMLSREYGWTPGQIREMSHLDVEIYKRIIAKRIAIEKTNRMRGQT
jgi:hypothetical protein